LLVARGDDVAAHDLLAPLYASFAEGHDTHDLRAAGALLARLRPTAGAADRQLVTSR
jgi:predicted ATPase